MLAHPDLWRADEIAPGRLRLVRDRLASRQWAAEMEAREREQAAWRPWWRKWL